MMEAAHDTNLTHVPSPSPTTRGPTPAILGPGPTIGGALNVPVPTAPAGIGVCPCGVPSRCTAIDGGAGGGQIAATAAVLSDPRDASCSRTVTVEPLLPPPNPPAPTAPAPLATAREAALDSEMSAAMAARIPRLCLRLISCTYGVFPREYHTKYSIQ